MYETGTISVSDRTKLMGLNNELHEYQKEYDEGSRETEAKEALLNRLEGSIAHAKSQIEENMDDMKNLSVTILKSSQMICLWQ